MLRVRTGWRPQREALHSGDFVQHLCLRYQHGPRCIWQCWTQHHPRSGLPELGSFHFKNFPIHERYRFEFRTEFFNVWNHVNPLLFPAGFAAGNPATSHGLDVTAGTNGCPTDNLNSNCSWGFAQSARDPRFIQLALKFYF